ncbi:hypothetical protein [Bradyrhizobium sp. WSM1253]|uniref:hypothetical protein n=1 Tax=Bradyrhizobium sp. WSM1253 TaxID=319003 RepID=UPI00025D209C|nr:hypothetical protein [Bradyrhizobium sp. WSM1253]EIG58453.1 hypothetical protein Bra1253DRAFT_03158 [Bradyrhizobium sp. WSM1253]
MVTRRDFIQGVALAASSGVVTRSSFAEFQPADSVQAIILSGFNQPGDRGRGALYARGDATGLLPIKDRSGSWWNLNANTGEVWAGWFGALGLADDTAALQLAIDHVYRQGGGTVRISAGEYTVASVSGYAEIAAHDDGQLVGFPAIEPEVVQSQAFAVRVPGGVRIVGEFGTYFKGSYTFGNASRDELICFAIDGSGFVQSVAIENITFRNYFMAIGSPKANLVMAKFENLRFENCALGLYVRQLERCYVDRVTAQGTGCVVAVGGQWCSREDVYQEGGGFCDKTYFGTIHNIYQRVMGTAEAAIDDYFDRSFYKTRNERIRLGPPTYARSIARNFKYRGLCGRAVYIMARHGRPSNANTFRLISHAYAPRAALWIDAALACTGDVVYLENCGYQDNVNRKGGIGEVFVDTYLGDRVRVPAFVKGVNCKIDAQKVFCERLVLEPESPDHFMFKSDVLFTSGNR